MSQAARLNDPIGHSPTMSWLLGGLIAAAAIAVTAVAVVGTGGLAAAAIIGGAAAAGGGIGEVMSTMSWAPKEEVGNITATGSPNVFTNGLRAIRAHLDTAKCDKHTDTERIATGSGKVFINSMPAARVDDKTTCSATITKGSPNVNIGGETVQTDEIHAEDLVPTWVHVALFVVGAGAAVVLAGPAIAVGGLVGGLAGGFGGSMLGGKLFGEGSDGQKWSMLAGSFLGGMLGGKYAANWKANANQPTSVLAAEGLEAPKPPPVPGDPDFIGPLSKIDNKILFGESKPGTNNIIGGHSPDVLNSPNYTMSHDKTVVNPDGTISVKDFKMMIVRKDGTWGWSKGKSPNTHTIAPPNWSNADILRAGQITAKAPGTVLGQSNGVTRVLHTDTINGVEWQVITENGVITSSFPTGGNGL
jgi:uncharacterized Zn-binding protein involved in type VI secretion